MSASIARTIFIIRHGEKPGPAPPPFGVDGDGNQNRHSLLPRGWQRAGALALLFAPTDTPTRRGIASPGQLIAPDYGDPATTAAHRTYQTIVPLSQLLGLPIETPYAEGQEAALGRSVATASSGVTLICWEHTAIPAIASAITPLAAEAAPPQSWPGERFDLIWSFTFNASDGAYTFSEVPELLLAGDAP